MSEVWRASEVYSLTHAEDHIGAAGADSAAAMVIGDGAVDEGNKKERRG